MRVAVVGSGSSGMAAARALLEAGVEVEVLDTGNPPEPEATGLAAEIRARAPCELRYDAELRRRLKRGLDSHASSWRDGLAALLGASVEAGRVQKRILGSEFVFEGIADGIPLEGGSIPRSLARGGLSNVWGAACYTLRPEDYAYWPLQPEDLSPGYECAAEQLRLDQPRDDLARAYPLEGAVSAPVPRNPGSAAERLNARWCHAHSELMAAGFSAGRARLAVRRPGREADACHECGLCVYGCAWDAIYSGRRTLAELERRPGFAYRPGRWVLRFAETESGVRVISRRTDGGAEERDYDALFLAAGTLSSLRIAADSLGLQDRPTPLLDNDLYLLPVVLRGKPVNGSFRSRFTLSEVVLALDPGRVSDRALHLQLYSFHEYFLAELAEVLAALPRPLQWVAWSVLNNLLLMFAYLPGSDSVVASARVQQGEPVGRVRIEQHPNPRSHEVRDRLLSHLWRHRSKLGFWPLPPLIKATPLGFSGHLAGSLPMRTRPAPLESHVDGRLAGTRQVYVVDGAALPDLPAQNLSFTLAANAVRVARRFAAQGVA